MVDYNALAEKIALAKLADMSREELEDYAYGYMMDFLDDLTEDELVELAEQYEVV